MSKKTYAESLNDFMGGINRWISSSEIGRNTLPSTRAPELTPEVTIKKRNQYVYPDMDWKHPPRLHKEIMLEFRNGKLVRPIVFPQGILLKIRYIDCNLVNVKGYTLKLRMGFGNGVRVAPYFRTLEGLTPCKAYEIIFDAKKHCIQEKYHHMISDLLPYAVGQQACLESLQNTGNSYYGRAIEADSFVAKFMSHTRLNTWFSNHLVTSYEVPEFNNKFCMYYKVYPKLYTLLKEQLFDKIPYVETNGFTSTCESIPVNSEKEVCIRLRLQLVYCTKI